MLSLLLLACLPNSPPLPLSLRPKPPLSSRSYKAMLCVSCSRPRIMQPKATPTQTASLSRITINLAQNPPHSQKKPSTSSPYPLYRYRTESSSSVMQIQAPAAHSLQSRPWATVPLVPSCYVIGTVPCLPTLPSLQCNVVAALDLSGSENDSLQLRR